MMEVPTISSAVYPKIFSAPLFQVMMTLFRSLLMMASVEDSTIAASRGEAISACFNSAMTFSARRRERCSISQMKLMIVPARKRITSCQRSVADRILKLKIGGRM